MRGFALGRPPVIGSLLVIQMPDASNKRRMAVAFRPIDRISLRLEGGEDVICVVFDYIIVDVTPFRTALGTCLDVDVRHIVHSTGLSLAVVGM
jgi:hypothetical protein